MDRPALSRPDCNLRLDFRVSPGRNLEMSEMFLSVWARDFLDQRLKDSLNAPCHGASQCETLGDMEMSMTKNKLAYSLSYLAPYGYKRSFLSACPAIAMALATAGVSLCGSVAKNYWSLPLQHSLDHPALAGRLMELIMHFSTFSHTSPPL